MSCLVLSCLALPCLALSCLALSCFLCVFEFGSLFVFLASSFETSVFLFCLGWLGGGGSVWDRLVDVSLVVLVEAAGCQAFWICPTHWEEGEARRRA
jgi:hypothetical protein